MQGENLIVNDVYEELKDIFVSSEQAMYIYLDDDAKVCNKKFASLLEYDSPEVWASITVSFPSAFVAENSQNILISAYQDAMEKGKGSSFNIDWKMKSGSTVKTNVILVPISYKGSRMALHFVTKS